MTRNLERLERVEFADGEALRSCASRCLPSVMTCSEATPTHFINNGFIIPSYGETADERAALVCV